MGENRNAYRILVVETPAGKYPFGRQRKRWMDSIKMNFKGTGCEDEGWMEVSDDPRFQWRALILVVFKPSVFGTTGFVT